RDQRCHLRQNNRAIKDKGCDSDINENRREVYDSKADQRENTSHQQEIRIKQWWHKVQGRAEGGMDAKLFRPAAAIRDQHLHERFQIRARTAVDDKIRIIQKLAAALLQLVHQRVLLVGVKLFVEAAQFEHG